MGVLEHAARIRQAAAGETCQALGVDWEGCMARFAGDEEAIYRLFGAFARNTAPLLAGLRRFDAASASEADLAAYAITVHGIKGASRGICCEAVGALAESLERAAKAGDRAAVAAGNPAFICAAAFVTEGLARLAARHQAGRRAPRRDAPDAAVLATLARALESYDMAAVDEAIQALEKWDYACEDSRGNGLVRRLREALDLSDFEAALAALRPAP